MTIGSGLFSAMKAHLSHLVHPGAGFGGEFFDLRKDIAGVLGNLAAIAVEEMTNPVGAAAPGAAALLDAAATVAAPVTVLKAALKAAGIAQLPLWPRAITFTTAGTTPSDAPANAVVTGKDAAGVAQTETVTLAQTATIATSTKVWSDITSVVYPAADGTGATVSIGIAAAELKSATATVATAVTLLAASLLQTDLSKHPRQLVFTTGGNTPAHAPANAVIVGKDINGNALTETVTLAQTATTATSLNCYASVSSITYPAADGTAATIAIGIAAPIGLRQPIKTRAGNTSLIREIVAGSVVTNGTVAAPASAGPNGSYTPVTAVADGVTDYTIYYEYSAQ